MLSSDYMYKIPVQFTLYDGILLSSPRKPNDYIVNLIESRNYSPEEYFISKEGIIYTKNISLAKFLNRIEAFHSSWNNPYIDANLGTKESKIIISGVESLSLESVLDLDHIFSTDDLKSTYYMQVNDIDEFKDISIEMIQNEYVDEFDTLKGQYSELGSNPNFIYRLLELGFYVSIDDETGYLHINCIKFFFD